MRVKAAALNFFDTLIIAGKYQHKPPFPFSPAAEFAGIVESVGAGVTDVAPGDRVHRLYRLRARRAKQSPSRPQQLVKLPDELDFERAAGLTVTYGTTLYALRDRAQLKPGETLVVLGASGGVGLAAIEIGKLMGARVIACASSDEKLAFARAARRRRDGELRQRRSARRAQALGGERGIDVVYDPVGGPYAEPAVRSLGLAGPLSRGRLRRRRNSRSSRSISCCSRAATSAASSGARGASASRRPSTRLMATSCAGAAEGKLSAHVHAAYPLAEIAAALKAIADRKVMGKIVLRP